MTKFKQEKIDLNEQIVILQNSIQAFKVQQGEQAVKLEALLKGDVLLEENRSYAKLMYYKKLFVDELIKEGQQIKANKKLETALAEILVQSGRKNGIYVDSDIKSNRYGNSRDRYNGTYLAVSHEELSRFINGNFNPEYDYNYLLPYKDKKDLG